MTLRYFRCFYECNECTRVGSEWTCERVTIGPDWCPNCELEAEPYDAVALFDECEADEDEDNPELTDLDPDRLREMHEDRLACLREIGGDD
jgi:hypothetical protein